MKELLAERRKTHGDFGGAAFVAQGLKRVMERARNHDKLDPRQAEAIDQIATKLSRILCGDPDHRDHWDDIAGYATLPFEPRDE